MMLAPLKSNNRGVAIIAVALLMIVATLLGGVIISVVLQDKQLSDVSYASKQSLYLAESAKERGYQEIFDNLNFLPANIDDPTTTADDPAPVTGSVVDPNANVTLGAPNTYSLMAYKVDDDPNPLITRMTATGFGPDGDDMVISVVAMVVRENVFIWNNAIFGGVGQSGGVINGNCAIHGSVHLLGDGVLIGNDAIAAIDLSGTSLIHNNYTGMSADLLAKAFPLDLLDIGGDVWPEDDIYTLNAKLRVKNGSVGVSGNSEIGEAHDGLNDIRETLKGIYIETEYDPSEPRWTGTAVTDGVPDPANVQSDNGTDALYDLGDAVTLPALDEEYYHEPTDTTWPTYRDYFNDVAVKLPPLTLDGSCDALTQIQAADLVALNPDGRTVTVTPDAAGCGFTLTDSVGNSLTYTPPTAKDDPATIVADGQFTIKGDLTVGQKGIDIEYSGEATFFAEAANDQPGNIDFHANVLPADGFQFTEEGAVFGFMADTNITIAGGAGDAQLSLAGAYYAEELISSAKQNQILGTFASSYFDMGTNVPSIYQVPNLANNLPPGLIGADPVWVTIGFDERSWRVESAELRAP